MAKYQHWYIRGWSYEDTLGRDGTIRRELKYRGEYYRPYLSEVGFRKMKILFTVLLLLTYLVYGAYSLHGASGGQVFYAGAGCVLAIIPLIFQGMGIFSIWIAPYEMTFRSYYASILRIKVASAFTGGLLAVSAAGQAVFMIVHRGWSGIVWVDEWCWLVGCVLCGAMSLTMCLVLRGLHFDILPGDIDTSALRRRVRSS